MSLRELITLVMTLHSHFRLIMMTIALTLPINRILGTMGSNRINIRKIAEYHKIKPNFL